MPTSRAAHSGAAQVDSEVSHTLDKNQEPVTVANDLFKKMSLIRTLETELTRSTKNIIYSGSGYQKPLTVSNNFLKEMSPIRTLESELT